MNDFMVFLVDSELSLRNSSLLESLDHWYSGWCLTLNTVTATTCLPHVRTFRPETTVVQCTIPIRQALRGSPPLHRADHQSRPAIFLCPLLFQLPFPPRGPRPGHATNAGAMQPQARAAVIDLDIQSDRSEASRQGRCCGGPPLAYQGLKPPESNTCRTPITSPQRRQLPLRDLPMRRAACHPITPRRTTTFAARPTLLTVRRPWRESWNPPPQDLVCSLSEEDTERVIEGRDSCARQGGMVCTFLLNPLTSPISQSELPPRRLGTSTM